MTKRDRLLSDTINLTQTDNSVILLNVFEIFFYVPYYFKERYTSYLVSTVHLYYNMKHIYRNVKFYRGQEVLML